MDRPALHGGRGRYGAAAVTGRARSAPPRPDFEPVAVVRAVAVSEDLDGAPSGVFRRLWLWVVVRVERARRVSVRRQRRRRRARREPRRGRVPRCGECACEGEIRQVRNRAASRWCERLRVVPVPGRWGRRRRFWRESGRKRPVEQGRRRREQHVCWGCVGRRRRRCRVSRVGTRSIVEVGGTEGRRRGIGGGFRLPESGSECCESDAVVSSPVLVPSSS